MIELTLLPPGTYRDLNYRFGRKKKTGPAMDLVPGLQLPQVPTQCVHVDIEELSEGYDYVRCVNDADNTGRHGWLCLDHQAATVKSRGYSVNKDAEVVAGILAYERRELSGVKRELVRIGKVVIQYC